MGPHRAAQVACSRAEEEREAVTQRLQRLTESLAAERRAATAALQRANSGAAAQADHNMTAEELRVRIALLQARRPAASLPPGHPPPLPRPPCLAPPRPVPRAGALAQGRKWRVSGRKRAPV